MSKILNKIFRRNEIIIKRFLIKNQPVFIPKKQFIIARSYDIIGQGYFNPSEKSSLQNEVKLAKIHYPTPEEIEEKKRLGEERYLRQRKLDLERLKDLKLFPTLTPRVKKKSVKNNKSSNKDKGILGQNKVFEQNENENENVVEKKVVEVSDELFSQFFTLNERSFKQSKTVLGAK